MPGAGLGGAGIGGFVGNLAVLLGAAGDGGEREYRRIVQEYENLRRQYPDFDNRYIAAPTLQQAAYYTPESYQAQIAGPATLPQVDPAGRQAQLQELAYFQDVRNRGLPLQERIAAQAAQRDVTRAHRQSLAAGERGLRERGRSGGAAEVGLRLGAAQQSADLANSQGLGLAALASQNRFAGAQAASGLAGEIRGQDIGLALSSADIMNRFNEFVTTQRNLAAAENANRRQAASDANVGRRQQVSDTNALSAFQAALQNQNRNNALAQQQFGNRTSTTEGLAGALRLLGQYEDAQQAQRRNAIVGTGVGLGGGIGSLV